MAEIPPSNSTPQGTFNHNGQWMTSPTEIEKLNRFQSDGIDYLYDLEPQSNNLFMVGDFMEGGGKDRDKLTRPIFNASYRIRSVNVSASTLGFKIDPFSRMPNLDAVNLAQDMTIEWIEDVYHSIKEYHLSWFTRWYNKQFDVLRCGVEGKFKKLKLYCFHYVNSASNYNTIIEAPTVQPIFVMQISGIVPETFEGFKFSYSEDGNDSFVSIKYKFSKAAIYYCDEVAAQDARDFIWGGNQKQSNTGALKAAIKTGDAKVWSPTNYFQDGGPNSTDAWERLRIARATTMHLPGADWV